MSESLEFNCTQLAALLGVSVATIRTALKEGAAGVQERGSRGKSAKIHAPAFVQWWIERERNKVGDQQRDLGSLAQRERQLDIEIKEDKVRRLREEVVLRAAAVDVIDHIHATCANAIRQAPRRFAHRLVQLPDMHAAVEALTAIGEEQCADLRRPETWALLRSPQALKEATASRESAETSSAELRQGV